MTSQIRNGKGHRAYRRQRDRMAAQARAKRETCTVCGESYDWADPNGPRGFTADHPNAIANGGRLVGQQLVGMCRSCNARKNDIVAPVLRPAT